MMARTYCLVMLNWDSHTIHAGGGQWAALTNVVIMDNHI